MTTSNQQVWAFQAPRDKDEEAKKLLYKSVMEDGKSRFGWSMKDEHDLNREEWSEWHSRQMFLLDVKKGDWIVHINLPRWGECVAAKVVKPYAFDEGLNCSWREEEDHRKDFRHCFEIDKESIIKFGRNDEKIIPSVNLKPRYRYHRVKKIAEFELSMRYVKEDKGPEDHLKNKIQDTILKEISGIIHEMNKSKKLESFLAKVFKKVPGVEYVKENGSGYGTDHGADLIVRMCTELGHKHLVIVQAKSYEGPHRDLKAVEQVKEGISKYKGVAGMVITTGERTQELEEKVQEVSENINIRIDLLDGTDLAKFVIKYAPELLFY